MNRSGFEIIRWVSSGRRVTGRSEYTIGAPIERLGTKCPSITSTWIRSAPARSASATCSPRRAKSAARIDGAIFTMSSSRGTGLLLEDVRELPVTGGDSVDRVGARDLFRTPGNERIPETGPAHRESNKA